VIVSSELLTVVTPTHEVSLVHRLETRSRMVGHWYLTSSVSVIDSAVKRSVTVTLPQTAGPLGCTASLTVEIPALASLAFRRREHGVLGVTEGEKCGEKN